MSKLSTFATTVLPALIAGGLIFHSARSHADAGGDAGLGFWPATGTGTLLAQAPPEAPEAPEPPMPPEPPRHVHAPRPPRPPRPPHAPHASGHDVQVSIHDGKIEVDGIKDLVGAKLDMVREMLSKNGSIPPDIREKILKRLDKVRGVTDRHLDSIHGEDMEHFGEEMEKMGEEIEQSMEGMGSDMERMGEQLGKDFGKKFSKDFAKHFGKDFAKNFKGGNFSVHIDSDGDHDDDHDADHDDDDDDNDAVAPGVPAVPAVDVADDDDMRAAIKDLGSLALRPEQRAQISRLRADSDRAVAVAQREMDNLSNQLHDALANPATSDTDIARYVDQISAQESAIRKARILAWADARRVLDGQQRKKVEDTAGKKHGK